MIYKGIINRIVLIFSIALTLSVCDVYVVKASNSGNEKTVRVGVFESSFFLVDENGRKNGYAYDYLQEVSYYTNWKYEYVEGNWTDLMQMLEDGEIDIIPDVSYTSEREGKMLFSDAPMGVEKNYLFADPSRNAGKIQSIDSLNNRRIGITGYNVATDMLKEWEKEKGIKTILIEYADDSLLAKAAEKGEIDAFIATDGFMSSDMFTPVFEIGRSDVFFGVTKSRSDLKSELDTAMRKILEVNPDFGDDLADEYLVNGVSTYLSKDQINWLKEHGKIRIGYRNDYIPYSSQDINGQTTGVIKDFTDYLTDCFNNVQIEVETIPFDNTELAFEALKKGEIDCVFPIDISRYRAENQGLMVTQSLLKTDMSAVVRDSSFSVGNNNIVAVNKGNVGYEEFVKCHFPHWTILETDTVEKAYEAVKNGNADCLLVTRYRVSMNRSEIEKYNLTDVSTGTEIHLSFVLDKKSKELLYILNRAIILVPKTDMYSAMTDYSISMKSVSFEDFMKQYRRVIFAIIIITFAVVVMLLIRSIAARKKTHVLNGELQLLLKQSEEQKIQLEEALENYQRADVDRRTDFLTGLRNRLDLFELIQEALASDDLHIHSVFLLDIDSFKLYNDHYGHEMGDQCLKSIGQALKEYGEKNNVIFYRYGGEEILGVLVKESDKSTEIIANEIVDLIRKLNIPRDDIEKNVVTVSLGYTTDNSRYEKMIGKADKALYFAKRKGKDCAVGEQEIKKE